MKLGFLLGYSGKQIHIPMELIRQAESMGFDSVWTAEAYGNDAVSVAAWVLAQTTKIRVGTAIMQMSARTPARRDDRHVPSSTSCRAGGLLRDPGCFQPVVEGCTACHGSR
ncbi:MAG: LLM class flavin-dependent oxidoreductase [Halioglobus sp.]